MPSQVSAITAVANALRAERPHAKLGFVGYCWGGRFAMSLNHLWDATVAAHPSLVKYPRELDEGVRKPFSLAVAQTDPAFGEARAHDTEKRLSERKEKQKVDFEVRVYKDVAHGWTTRGDMNDPVKRTAREDARDQVVNWFNKHLAATPATEPISVA